MITAPPYGNLLSVPAPALHLCRGAPGSSQEQAPCAKSPWGSRFHKIGSGARKSNGPPPGPDGGKQAEHHVWNCSRGVRTHGACPGLDPGTPYKGTRLASGLLQGVPLQGRRRGNGILKRTCRARTNADLSSSALASCRDGHGGATKLDFFPGHGVLHLAQ